MNLQSFNQLPILTETVTIDVTPLSRYGHNTDLAKITTHIRLSSPLQQETKFVLPCCDEAINPPKVYLPDGQTITSDFDPTTLENIAQLPNLITISLNEYLANPTTETLNKHSMLTAEYLEFKESNQIMTIPAGAEFITFTYSKYINKNTDDSFTLETMVPLTSFSITNTPGAKLNLTILMPFEIGTDFSKILESTWERPDTGQVEELDRSNVSERMVLSKYWQYDPKVLVKYKYN